MPSLDKYPDIFVADSFEPIRVALPDTEHWIDIKPAMSMEDYQDYDSGLMRMEATHEASLSRSRAQGAKTNINLNTGDVDLIHRNIHAWSFEDVAITKKSVGRLQLKWRNLLLDAINEANQTTPFSQDPAQS